MAKRKPAGKSGKPVAGVSVLDGLEGVDNTDGDLNPDEAEEVVPDEPSPEMIARENARTAAIRAEAKKDDGLPPTPRAANERDFNPSEEEVAKNRESNESRDDADPVGKDDTAKIPKKPSEPILFFSKYLGLKIAMEPEDYYYEEIGPGRKRRVKVKGKHIKFVDGKFVTKDPEVIAFLKNWMKSHQGEVYTTNPQTTRLARAIAKIKDEDARAARKGTQGVVGGT